MGAVRHGHCLSWTLSVVDVDEDKSPRPLLAVRTGLPLPPCLLFLPKKGGSPFAMVVSPISSRSTIARCAKRRWASSPSTIDLPKAATAGDCNSWYGIQLLGISNQTNHTCLCTKCNTLIFYTVPYPMADAETLLKHIDRRNFARRMNLPAPQQGIFLPAPVLIQPKVGGQCRGDGCSKDPNKACVFSLCKACCDGRPSGTKTCLTHRLGAKGSRAHAPPTTTPRPPAMGAVSLPLQPRNAPIQSQSQLVDQPVARPTSTLLRCPDQSDDPPSLSERSHNTQPGLIPRSDPGLSGAEASR